MEDLQVTIDFLEHEEIEDALRMTDDQRFRAGGDLFEYACWIAMAGIKSQYPEFTDEQVFEELRRRVELGDDEGAAE